MSVSGTASGSSSRSIATPFAIANVIAAIWSGGTTGSMPSRSRPARQQLGQSPSQGAVALDELGPESLVARRVQGELEEEPVPLGLSRQHPHQPLGCLARLLVRVGLGREDPIQLRQPGVEVGVEHREEELILVGEVRVYSALGEAGSFGDLVQRRALDPAP